uniref:DUF4120 domain-containing protein n=1 Tax=Angiostrongylus cantonensis TaxID=6313 RepID=A0A0K0DNZ5_ANGCA
MSLDTTCLTTLYSEIHEVLPTEMRRMHECTIALGGSRFAGWKDYIAGHNVVYMLKEGSQVVYDIEQKYGSKFATGVPVVEAIVEINWPGTPSPPRA